MRIALLARNPNLYSHQRLMEAAKERGHEIQWIDTMKVYLKMGEVRPEMRYKGEEMPQFDAVIPRIGASITFFGTAVLRQFEVMGVYPLNESVAISRSRDKLRSMQLLSRRGVKLPVTGVANGTRQTDDLIHMMGGPPLVIKLVEGTQGVGVVLGDTMPAVKSMINAFAGLEAHILVQEFIKEAGNEDIRCLVVGEKVVASMRRKGPEGDFRSNLHRGGSAHAVKITPAERATAVKAAKVMGLNVCGVDMLRSDRGPLVMEVNSSPGLEGIEKSTHLDIAGKIIEFIEKDARPHRTKTKGKG
ncbi:putative alpha-L-glutamate ligase [Iodidimonas gelatinilytica]|uniref:Probable alpha-L-glutamate ligase n=1 Tax=Iodidimonas gelatinilytica TaxID=1236966 RepID=A0A5A7MVW3_9PROT|nr:30S ribosomal protein S6--L-glutamate ligase [Iodidimonas gelatinilytica]GEQ97350.1 putative alpha-L-glutamate ligase [Iodidimonas gelatinilytica]GEQ99674.1 putative alpha-L-glutamate ligase [Iodidimonas gelatinilytica]